MTDKSRYFTAPITEAEANAINLAVESKQEQREQEVRATLARIERRFQESSKEEPAEEPAS